MDDNFDYTIEELLEDAKKDSSWEPDAEKRNKLVNRLKEVLEDT